MKPTGRNRAQGRVTPPKKIITIMSGSWIFVSTKPDNPHIVVTDKWKSSNRWKQQPLLSFCYFISVSSFKTKEYLEIGKMIGR